MKSFKVSGQRSIGYGQPAYIIAEIGINHNGSLDIAKKLIDEAAAAGCDAVKFQKRTPEICTPKDQWHIERDTPWGRMTYINYRKLIEFGFDEYKAIDEYCKEKKIDWFVSCWDEEAVDFMEQFNPGVYKFASASLTDHDLIAKVKSLNKPYILSTGMSTMNEIKDAVEKFGTENLIIAHSTSAYPCPPEQLNLKMIHTLQDMYPDVPVGYSGHETGLATTVAAVAMGACLVERHFTLDRAMWGSDQAASVEPQGMQRLVKDIRDVEQAMGDGIKRVYDSELAPMKRLRKVITPKAEKSAQ
ncbi:N-acetylneuraminate synthase family protein [Ferruginibacter albus]|uniref:N-acetylneuraminate synthase family protein n=1 Tax=Ferruginibacter albus TaxID=2875540 RepID=UPI001CC506C6|nr:N-acetylneuraminate synthase family protein [Ferruginibacter albus]UAY51521.1 N-acetylneuraminate synthase family protein [Ferruginibacter albus]